MARTISVAASAQSNEWLAESAKKTGQLILDAIALVGMPARAVVANPAILLL